MLLNFITWKLQLQGTWIDRCWTTCIDTRPFRRCLDRCLEPLWKIEKAIFRCLKTILCCCCHHSVASTDKANESDPAKFEPVVIASETPAETIEPKAPTTTEIGNVQLNYRRYIFRAAQYDLLLSSIFL